jgi:peptidyl-tRNA hydrolase, PTH1 family
MVIILGLGNPGPRYLLTRHNAGFRVVDRLAKTLKSPLYKVGYHSFYGRARLDGQVVILAKPMTYMNRSGQAAAALCRYFSVEPEQMLVVCDDLELPAGRIRLRSKGGSGGHNGLSSIIEHLGSEEFPRLRIGIDRPANQDVADYVLDEFPADEEGLMEDVFTKATDAAMVFLKEGIEAAMNKFNQKTSNI